MNDKKPNRIKLKYEQLTVKQIQDLYKAKDYYDVLRALYGLSKRAVDNERPELIKELLAAFDSLVLQEPAIKLNKHLVVNGKRYKVILDPDRLPPSSKASILKFYPKKLTEFTTQMGYLAARLVQPMKKNFLGFWVAEKHNQSEIQTYIDDLEQLPITDVVGLLMYYNFIAIGCTGAKSIEENEQIITNRSKELGTPLDDVVMQIGKFHQIFNCPNIPDKIKIRTHE